MYKLCIITCYFLFLVANCAFILNKNVTEVLAEIVGDVKSGSVVKWNGRDYDEVRSLLRSKYKINFLLNI